MARVAYIQAQVACALIELEGMKAENRQREIEGKSLAYTEAAFDALLHRYAITHNDVMNYL